MSKLIYGWGINDADYNVYKTETIDGKRKNVWQCPYYRDWCSMLSRVFGKKGFTYKNILICDEWKFFTNFKSWVDNQPNKNWENCQIDKDFLSRESKIYSPETCVYISAKLNSFITERANDRGLYLLGVTWHKHRQVFVAQCANPFGETAYEKRGYIGGFSNEIDAHFAWKTKKHEYALLLAKTESDYRVVERLTNMYKGGEL